MKNFKIGDKVRITNLDRKGIPDYWAGKIGHEGVIVKFGSYQMSGETVVMFHLEPKAPGSCWPESCLELVERFDADMDDVHRLFEEKVKQIQNGKQ